MQVRARKRMDHMMGHAHSDDPDVTRDLIKYGLGVERTLEEFSAFCGVDFKARVVSEYALRCGYVKDLMKYKDSKIFIPEIDDPEQFDAENNAPKPILAFPDPALSAGQPFDTMLLANNTRRRLSVESGAPEGILVVHDYIERRLCESLQRYAQAQAFQDQPIGQRAEIDGMTAEILSLFNDVFCHRLAPFYNVGFEWYERPHFVRYPEGARYAHRSDASQWNAEAKKWVRAADRDYSAVLVVSDFQGGEVHFTDQNYRIKPRIGTLLAFPSDHRYLYSVLPATSGARYEIASWGAAMGTARVRPLAPYASVFLRQKRQA
jgi:hypothetical protein